jgi:hypothetical protein
MLGSGGSGSALGAGALDMRASGFGNTILGEAVNKAVTQVASALEQQAAKVPAKEIKIDGVIADVSGNTLVLSVGKRAGVNVGDRLTVIRTGREIKNPETGQVLRRMETTLGEITITEVDDVSSVGTYNGSQPPKVGDRVKK